MGGFEFKVESEHGVIEVEGDDGAIFVSQIIGDKEPDREPGDHDIIVMKPAEAHEFHRLLGDALANLSQGSGQ